MQSNASLLYLQACLHVGYPLVGPELMALHYGDASNAIEEPTLPAWLTAERADELICQGFRFIWATGKTASEVLQRKPQQKTSRQQTLDHIGTAMRGGFQVEQPAFAEETTAPGLYMFSTRGLSSKFRLKGHDIVRLTQSLMTYLVGAVPEAVRHLAGESASFQKACIAKGEDKIPREALLRHPLRQALLPSLPLLVETIVAWDHINEVSLFRGRPVMTVSAVNTAKQPSEGSGQPTFLVENGEIGLYITDDTELKPQNEPFIDLIPFVKIA